MDGQAAMTIDFTTQETRNIIKSLQQSLNVLVIWHPSIPNERKVFSIRQFIPAENMVSYHDLKGKDITHLISLDYFSQYAGKTPQNGYDYLKKQTFDTTLEEIPMRHYQFSQDFCYELYLSD